MFVAVNSEESYALYEAGVRVIGPFTTQQQAEDWVETQNDKACWQVHTMEPAPIQ